jgi:hypothetical protein
MRRPSPALVLSCVAVFLCAAGGAVAAGQINGKQIKDGSITGKDIKNDSLTGSDIKGNVRGPEGPPGARGATGPQGPAALGSPGGVTVSYRFADATVAADGFTPVEALCPAGQVAVGGGFSVTPPVTVRFSRPGEGGGRDGGSWEVLFEAPDALPSPVDVSAYAACTAGTAP